MNFYIENILADTVHLRSQNRSRKCLPRERFSWMIIDYLTDSLMNFSSEEDTDARSVSLTLRTLWLEESESTQVQAVVNGTMTDPIVQEPSLKLLGLLERDRRGNEQLSQQCRRLQTENRRLSEANAEMRRTKIKIRPRSSPGADDWCKKYHASVGPGSHLHISW